MNLKKRLELVPILVGALTMGFILFAGVWGLLAPATFTERLVTLIVASIFGVVGTRFSLSLIKTILEMAGEA